VPDTTETLVTGLRHWTRDHDLHVRAAVELLIDHGFWLRRQDFTRLAVHRDSGEAWINWRAAREFVNEGAVASTSEMAILDLAVALGEDRFRFNIMGPNTSRMIARAVADAVGVTGA
jgi:hypothetical protein